MRASGKRGQQARDERGAGCAYRGAAAWKVTGGPDSGQPVRLRFLRRFDSSFPAERCSASRSKQAWTLHRPRLLATEPTPKPSRAYWQPGTPSAEAPVCEPLKAAPTYTPQCEVPVL